MQIRDQTNVKVGHIQMGEYLFQANLKKDLNTKLKILLG